MFKKLSNDMEGTKETQFKLPSMKRTISGMKIYRMDFTADYTAEERNKCPCRHSNRKDPN